MTNFIMNPSPRSSPSSPVGGAAAERRSSCCEGVVSVPFSNNSNTRNNNKGGRRLLDKDSLKFMQEHPLSVEGKATKRLLLERIMEDPILFRELRKKLRESKQHCCYTNAGIIAHLNNCDSKLLQEMAQHVLASDERRTLLQRQRSMSEQDLLSKGGCRSKIFMGLLSKGLFNRRDSSEDTSDDTTVTSCSSRSAVTYDSIKQNNNSPWFLPLPSRSNNQSSVSECEQIMNDYGWQIIMERKEQLGYSVVEPKKNNRRQKQQQANQQPAAAVTPKKFLGLGVALRRMNTGGSSDGENELYWAQDGDELLREKMKGTKNVPKGLRLNRWNRKQDDVEKDTRNIKEKVILSQ